MQVPRVTIFWTAEDRLSLISAALRAGRLRQGWGIPGTSLTDGGRPIPSQSWVDNYRRAWNNKPTVESALSRHRILSRLLHIGRGDLIVVPRMPGEQFCIGRAAGEYEFEVLCYDDGVRDFGHIIPIEVDSLRSFRPDSSRLAAEVKSRLHHYRSAVNTVNDAQYSGMIRQLYDDYR